MTVTWYSYCRKSKQASMLPQPSWIGCCACRNDPKRSIKGAPKVTLSKSGRNAAGMIGITVRSRTVVLFGERKERQQAIKVD